MADATFLCEPPTENATMRLGTNILTAAEAAQLLQLPKRGGTALELREHQRLPVQMSILLGPPNGPAEEGIALNLSLGGCAIRLTRRISKDLIVLLRMCVPGDAEPISIETAVTRWFKDQVFAVEFLSLTAPNRQRLQSLIERLKDSASTSSV